MKCSICGEELNGSVYLTDDDELICYNCREEYDVCNICGRVITSRSGYQCKSCEDITFNKVINSYSTKVTSVFKNKCNSNKNMNNRYYGMELEFSHVSPALAFFTMKDLYKNKLIYNKSDASLDNGVEIVTVPMVKSKMVETIDKMNLMDLYSSEEIFDNAGVHFHVSRNTIDPIDIVKLSLLFNCKTSGYYRNYIYYITGRLNFLTKDMEIEDDDGDEFDNYFKIGSLDKNRVNDKYISSHNLALNLGNKNTIEFRMFKSTTDKYQLKSYIEFIERSIEFVEKTPIKRINLNNFIRYLRDNTNDMYILNKIEDIEKYDNSATKDIDNITSGKDVLNRIDSYNLVDKFKILNRLKYYDNITTDLIDSIDLSKEFSEYYSDNNNNIIQKAVNILKDNVIEKIINKDWSNELCV